MAWSVLQSASNSGDATSITATFSTANVQAGNKIIAAVSSGTIAVSSVKDGAGNSWTQIALASSASARVYIFALDVPAGDAGTKPALTATAASSTSLAIVIQEVSGLLAGNTTAMADGSAGTLTGTASSTGSPSYSSTASNEYLVSAYGDVGSGVTVSTAGGWTGDANNVNSSAITNCLIQYKNSTNGSETDGFTGADSGGWAVAEVAFKLPAAAGVTYVPQRYGQAAAPSPAPWEQRPYRSVPGAADTPANPLPSPLDSAWQAGAQYWHLYGDSADAAARTWANYQRPLVSDPNLLAGVPADPLQLNPEQSPSSDLWRVAAVPAFYDRREVPQQRAYYDVTLLAAAQLENELLGGAETPKYYRQAATHADRREYPYQPKRDAYTPGLLDQALLENELLGGAGTAQRYGFAAYYDRREVPQQPARLADPLLIQTAELENELLGGAQTGTYYRTPATHYARWWMPQQPARLADPLLIATALLENELLGGAETWLHYITSAWIDRREVPQQRAYISDPSFYPPPNPLDPLLAGQGWLDGHQHQAATHYDRREVPQQRAYISDPSFYPSGAVTDPLTVAWGAGGPYWHLYARAADAADRREYFTQRLYQSDPLLLLSAQLENELLGGAQTGTYYRTPATHYARWWMPQQPARLADPLLIATALLENELLGGGDTSRCYLTAAYWDRREVPQQRPYVSDPLLLLSAQLENELLGGAGTLMRYLQPATQYDRREVPAQPARLALQLPLVPLDPTQSAWAALWLAYNLAATHQDRRLYPQQRLYWPVPLPGPAFTAGTLTAADAALAVLTATAAAGASGGVLTATDQRTGGPA